MRDPAPPYRGEGPHALWHVSGEAAIGTFEPHRSATALTDEPLVWTVDTRHLPLFWFPRDCPRATFWADSTTSAEDAERFLLGRRGRVHAIEWAWLDRFLAASVFAYRLPEPTFAPHPEVGGYWISREPVEPVDVVVLAELARRHAEAEIELRVVSNLWPLWARVTASTLEFSGIRLRNAAPAPAGT